MIRKSETIYTPFSTQIIPSNELHSASDYSSNNFRWLYFIDYSHAIAGGFSPAIATALYTKIGLTAASLVYVVFGSLSVAGLYINLCCGKGDKEEDSGSPMPSKDNESSLEMQESTSNNPSDVGTSEEPTESPTGIV